MYNHLINSPSRNFILDIMLPTPWRLSTHDKISSMGQNCSQLQFFFQWLAPIQTLSRTWSVPHGCFPAWSPAHCCAELLQLFWTATQCFTKLRVISLEHAQSQIMYGLGQQAEKTPHYVASCFPLTTTRTSNSTTMWRHSQGLSFVMLPISRELNLCHIGKEQEKDEQSKSKVTAPQRLGNKLHAVKILFSDTVMCIHIPVEKMTLLDVITEKKQAATPFLTLRNMCNMCKVDLYLALNPKTWTQYP